MDNAEARTILSRELAKYRLEPYASLQRLLHESEAVEVCGAQNTTYQIKFTAFWDDPNKPGGILRVCGAIDDGGWRAFLPLADSFLMRPDGSFHDE